MKYFYCIIFFFALLYSSLNVNWYQSCNELISSFDYTNDWILNSADTAYLSDLVSGSEVCPTDKICDLWTNEQQEIDEGDIYTQVDLAIYTVLVDTGDFPVAAFVLHTLEDFCPTQPQWAPYDVSLDPCFLSQLDYDDNGVVDVEDRRWVYRAVWEWNQSCPVGKICSFEYYGQCDENFQLADSINLWYFILWHVSLEDFKEQIGKCHQTECAPTQYPYIVAEDQCFLEKLDYTNDGVVDFDDQHRLTDNVINWNQSCPVGKICEFNGFGYTFTCEGIENSHHDILFAAFLLSYEIDYNTFKTTLGLCNELTCNQLQTCQDHYKRSCEWTVYGQLTKVQNLRGNDQRIRFERSSKR